MIWIAEPTAKTNYHLLFAYTNLPVKIVISITSYTKVKLFVAPILEKKYVNGWI